MRKTTPNPTAKNNVIQFPNSKPTVSVFALKKEADNIFALTAGDDSLKSFDILDGDLIILKKAGWENYDQPALYSYVDRQNNTGCGFIIRNGKTVEVIKTYIVRRYQINEIELTGLVTGFQRSIKSVYS